MTYKEIEAEFERKLIDLAEQKPLLKTLKEQLNRSSYVDLYKKMSNCPIKRELENTFRIKFDGEWWVKP